ncbi:hypothetical protein CVD28_04505 [Bacillus sp. M6-12]|uniref:hypothetical protein n=1 Tax=Bacillus sp. M6-12 TaxID=2054166 RepID=UPI000C793398|nr:hypothetical protein [Bacillus sp. M6-12]PLS19681.1 hypothetical protein CVD28_04505 [Bacillus sp. M6-12]
MSSFIHREIAKTTLNGEEIYVCMYVHEEVLVNLSFFKKTDVGFEEMLRHDVPAETGKELVRRVRANDVEKVTPTELKVFNQSLNMYNILLSKEIKGLVSKSVNGMKVEYVGELAGMNYIVSKSDEMKIQQIYMLQKAGVESGFEIGRIPAPFVEMILLDYVHHNKVGEKASYFMVDQNQFFGLKESKSSRIIYVVKIDVFPESVSATKAYMISKKNHYEYTLLPIQESTPQLMSGLQEEGKKIINQFIKEMNMTAQ